MFHRHPFLNVRIDVRSSSPQVGSLKFYRDILPILPLIFTAGIFDHSRLFTRSNFETKQLIRNIKHSLTATIMAYMLTRFGVVLSEKYVYNSSPN